MIVFFQMFINDVQFTGGRGKVISFLRVFRPTALHYFGHFSWHSSWGLHSITRFYFFIHLDYCHAWIGNLTVTEHLPHQNSITVHIGHFSVDRYKTKSLLSTTNLLYNMIVPSVSVSGANHLMGTFVDSAILYLSFSVCTVSPKSDIFTV